MSKTVKSALIIGGFALIGVVITGILTAYVANIPIHATATAEFKAQQTQNNLHIMSMTQTAEAKAQQAQSGNQTPVPSQTNSPTPINSETPALTATFRPGEDISKGCIWNYYWKYKPPESIVRVENDCLIFTDYQNIYLANGAIKISTANSSNNFPFAIYTYLPNFNNGENNDIDISLSIVINGFEAKQDGSALFFGIGDSDSGTWRGQFVSYSTYPGFEYIYVSHINGLDKDTLRRFAMYTRGRKTELIFSIRGLKLSVTVDTYDGVVKTRTETLPPIIIDKSDRKAFWIGYSLRSGSMLDATISDFKITTK
jgi:hypothetical protein